MVELTEAGCIGFSQADVPIVDTAALLRALQYATTYGYTVWLRPQDAYMASGGVAASGALASRLGLVGRAGVGGNDRAAYDFRTGARDGRAGASVASVVGGGHRTRARGEGRRACR